MKCPKCGYNSFEFLDACKKCGAEFTSFKKTHRIRPVILTPNATPEVKPPAQEPTASASVVPPPAAGSPDDQFSWETSGESSVTGPEESPGSGSDLGFQESLAGGTQDTAFTGFSFFEEEADQPPAREVSPQEQAQDEFSFEEASEDKDEASSVELKFEEPATGMEGYENLLDLDTLKEKEADSERGVDSGRGLTGDFEADDFSFAPEPVVEDIFHLEEETGTSPSPEKKAQPSLADFDKEFEQIFSFGDSDDTEEDSKQ